MAIATALACGGRTSNPETGTGSGGSESGGGGSTGTGGTSGGSGGNTTTGGSGANPGSGGAGGAAGAFDAAVDWGACTGPGQCELAMKCCACGVLGLDQLTPIHSANRDAFKKQSCGPNPLPCPPCVGTIDPNLMARCESGRCQGFDIRSDPTYTKCGSDQECTLRKGLACCECGAEGNWVAVSHVGNMLIGRDACAVGSVCPGCIPVPPGDLFPRCDNGTCRMFILLKQNL